MAITYTYEFPEPPKLVDITIDGVDYVNLISELVFKKIGTDDNGVTAERTETMFFAITQEFLNTSALTPFADLTHAKIVEWMDSIGTGQVDVEIEEAIRNKTSIIPLPF